ncbi:hypothetical protein B0H67DRAFT_644665 [Lasiosphaeris hirsuta]|uniref:Uncharacterized protein n=1 Tax=Lasiosphaeris hirsuta TaxID=260670 RepID=A0AA40DSS7_9PEZI|nr:hypothetical protein B0H67DRAFT_644665 [Lasiosphaeris hirsuta]
MVGKTERMITRGEASRRGSQVKSYLEYQGPTTADRPLYAHQDVPFSAELARHAAFPSLPFNHQGPRPLSVRREEMRQEAAERERQERLALQDSDNDDPTSSEDESGSDNDEALSHSVPRFFSPENGWRLIVNIRGLCIRQYGRAQATTAPAHYVVTIRRESKYSPFANIGQPGQLLPAAEVLRQAYVVANPNRGPQPLALEQDTSTRGNPPPPRWDDGILSSFGDEFESFDDYEAAGNIAGRSFQLRNLGQSIPNWQELTEGTKYLIIYVLSQRGISFTGAVRTLGISHAEAVAMINLISTELAKMKALDIDMSANHNMTSTNMSWLDENRGQPRVSLVTDRVSPDDAARGRTFLSFMGLGADAACFDNYIGTAVGGTKYEVPVNHFVDEGWRGLMPHFNILCNAELEKMAAEDRRLRRLQPRAMTGGELLARMDPPRAQ